MQPDTTVSYEYFAFIGLSMNLNLPEITDSAGVLKDDPNACGPSSYETTGLDQFGGLILGTEFYVPIHRFEKIGNYTGTLRRHFTDHNFTL